MCLAGNSGACDGEAVVVILDLIREGMPLGITPVVFYTIEDANAALQITNHQLRVRNENLKKKLRDKSMIENAALREKCDKFIEQYNIARKKYAELQKTHQEKIKELQKTHQEEIKELETKHQNKYDKLRRKMNTKLDNSRLQTAELEKELKQVTNNDTSVGLKEFRQDETIQSDVIDWNRAFTEHAFLSSN